MISKVKTAIAALAVALTPLTASAVDFSFQGTFDQDDDVQLFAFAVGLPSLVTLRTYSYAGGVNAAGDTIAQGGFDPILAVFDSLGNEIGQNDDGGCALVAADSETGQCWDTFFQENLAPGNYFVSVQEYDNFSLGSLAAGFSRDGEGNFTSGFGCADAQDAFNDVSGGPGCGRENFWAFDILNVGRANVIAEPAQIALFGFGVAGLGFGLRRRARA